MAQSRIGSLVSDTMIYGVFTIVGRFLTFLLNPIYTNYLNQSENGNLQNLFAIFAFIMIIYSLGMETAFFRFYKKDDLEYSKKVFSLPFLFIAVMAGIISVIVFIIPRPFANMLIEDLPNKDYLIRLSVFIPLTDALMILPYSLLRMTRRAKKFAMTRFILIIIAVTLNLVFLIFFKMGFQAVLWAQVITNVVGVMMFFPEIKQYLVFKYDKTLFKEMMAFGLPTVPAALSAIILQVADRPILKALTNSSEVAMYSINYKLGIPMMLFVSVFEYAWKPFYLSHFEDKDAKQLFARILIYFTFACSLMFMVTGLFIPFLVKMPFIGGRFINPLYWSGLGIVPIILGGYFFNGLFNNFAVGFQIKKKTSYFPLAVGAAACVNIAMNFALIPITGIYGAAWATFVAYLVSALILYHFSRKIYPINYNWKKFFTLIILCVIVYFTSEIVTVNLNHFLSILIRLMFFAVYLVLIVTLKVITIDELKSMKKMFARK